MKLSMKSVCIHVLMLSLTVSCIAQWKQTSGPTGGPVQSLALIDSTLFAGCVSGYGVTRSSNFGEYWQEFQLTGCNVVDFIEFHNAIVSATNAGIFFSTNHGASWAQMNNGLTTSNLTTITANESTMFVGSSDAGIFRATNLGSAWISSNSGIDSYNIVDVFVLPDSSFNNGSSLYASTSNHGTYQSSNNGMSWAAKLGLYSIRTFGVLENTLFAGGINEIFRSSDNGETWSSSFSQFELNVSCFLSTKNKLFAGTKSGILRSLDNGLTWSFVNSGLSCLTVQALTGLSDTLFAGTRGGGVYVSYDNGETWTVRSSGILRAGVYSLAVGRKLGSNGPIEVFAALGNAGVFLTTDNGLTWEDRSAGLGVKFSYNFNSLLVVDTNLYLATNNGVFVSTNSGKIWEPRNNGLSFLEILDVTGNSDEIYCYVNAPYTGSIWRSTNGGQNWLEVNTPNSFYSFATCGNNLILGSTPGIYVSTDHGSSWPIFNSNIKESHSIAVSNANVFAKGWLSTDCGLTWEQANAGLPSSYAVAMRDSFMLATAGSNIYISTNLGQSWTIANSGGIKVSDVTSLAIAGEYAFAATQTFGVWGGALSTITDVWNWGPNSPNKVLTLKNYPNPFNPFTTIVFNVPNSSFVTLKVYDILGNEVAELINDKLNEGEYKISWNAIGIPSGVYFCRIYTNGFVETKKMLLLK